MTINMTASNNEVDTIILQILVIYALNNRIYLRSLKN